MKQRFLFILILALFLPACSPVAAPAAATAAPSPAASTTPEITPLAPVYITAFCTLVGKEADTHIKQNTPVIITWGWEAKTEAQINDYLQANITTITLDGNVIEGIQQPGIQKNQKSGSPEVVWYAKMGVLAPGAHTITYDVRWSKMIDDGTSTYGPGGKTETSHDECRIIVE